MNDLCNWRMEVSSIAYDSYKVPYSAKVRAFEIVAHMLDRITDLQREIDGLKLKIPTHYRKDGGVNYEILHANLSGNEYELECTGLFHCIRDLFQDVMEIKTDRLKSVVSMWSEADGHFIRKFKLYALNQEKLYDADEVADTIRNSGLIFVMTQNVLSRKKSKL